MSVIMLKINCKNCGKIVKVLKCVVDRKKYCSAHCRALNARKSHGMSRTRLYRCWCSMKTRCRGTGLDRIDRNYVNRGITVCEEWEAFKPFSEWAICTGYSDNLELDRIDSDKGYSPANCRWATRTQQSRNRRKQEGMTSRYKGVSKSKCRNKWQTQIRKNGKPVTIGFYDSEEEAAEAYNKEAVKEFGEFARLNSLPKHAGKAGKYQNQMDVTVAKVL